jgi:hypothetical protein
MYNKKRTFEQTYRKICELAGVNPNKELLKEQQEIKSGGASGVQAAPRPDDMGNNAYMLLGLNPGDLDQAVKFTDKFVTQSIGDKIIYNDFKAKQEKKIVTKWKAPYKIIVKWYDGDKDAMPANLVALINKLQAKGMPVLGSEFGQGQVVGSTSGGPSSKYSGEVVLDANNKISNIQHANGLTLDKTGNALLPFVKTKNAIVVFDTGTNNRKIKIEFVATVVDPDATSDTLTLPELKMTKDLFADDSDTLNKENVQYKEFISKLTDYLKSGQRIKGIQIESSTSKVPSMRFKNDGGNETLARLRAEALKNAITEDLSAAGVSEVNFLEPILKPNQGPDFTASEYFSNGKFIEDKKQEYNQKYGPFRYVTAKVVV